MRRSLALVAAALLAGFSMVGHVAAAEPVPSAAAAARALPTGAPDPAGRYLVMLKGGTDTKGFVHRAGTRDGITADRRFDRAFKGFAAKLSAAQRRELLADPNVLAVVPDEVISTTAQTTPTGVSRIGGKLSTVAAINGLDGRVDADVAIVDTGIAKHSDLNIAGGYNCTTSDRTAWNDEYWHGTHVAGTVAALDNASGVVGVAPGARLWAVRILNKDGYGLLSWYVCGLDWILAQRDPVDPTRPLIEAVNMSVTKWGTDDHACGATNDDILHVAICRVVKGGITVVAAAANDSASAAKRVPASYDEVITVSALADTDGKAGGVGGTRCYDWGSYDKDDTFANFSNYGADVDLIAPGKCIWSTIPGGYSYSSGTSMATPAVTGAVALYKASRPKATPAEVREALRYLGNQGWDTSTDPDATHEPLLNVSKIGKLGTFAFASPQVVAPVDETGGTATVPIAITRSATFFERVALSVTGVPAGWNASFSPSSLMGWGSDTTSLMVQVPAETKAGTYQVQVKAVNQGRVKTQTVAIAVDNDQPTAKAATFRPLNGTTVGVSTTNAPNRLTTRIEWPAATDPSTEIAGYELERRHDGGPWGSTIALDATARYVDIANLHLDRTYDFRTRARDQVGNWSDWVETGPTLAFKAVSDRSSAITYKGSWSKVTVSSATNGTRTSSTDAGATATYHFTGRAIALVMPRSALRGRVTVYIDGVNVATVDTKTATVQPRRVVFHREWATAGAHRITVKVNGTAGRPTVSIDSFIVHL